jgi:endonuclease III
LILFDFFFEIYYIISMKTANENHIDRIIHDIGILDPSEKLEILERLVCLIKESNSSEPKKEYSLLQLRGLGKEIWTGVDTDRFIENERNSWM